MSLRLFFQCAGDGISSNHAIETGNRGVSRSPRRRLICLPLNPGECAESYGAFQRAASQQEPSYRVKGALTDGFDSTVKSMRALFPGGRLGNCLRHALLKLPAK